MKDKQLQPITSDLIRELRLQGKYTEAHELILAHQNDVMKVKKDTQSDLNRIDRRLKKHFGICMGSSCKREAVKGRNYCQACLDSFKKASKKFYKKKKNQWHKKTY